MCSTAGWREKKEPKKRSEKGRKISIEEAGNFFKAIKNNRALSGLEGFLLFLFLLREHRKRFELSSGFSFSPVEGRGRRNEKLEEKRSHEQKLKTFMLARAIETDERRRMRIFW
jgi:hypothetical protein